jgi:starvation-inducible DNA-binding protein
MYAPLNSNEYILNSMTLQTKTTEIGMSINTGLLEKNRVEVVTILNTVLANEFVLSTKTRNYHWNVTGPNFSELHKFFDEQYGQLDDILDQVAERSRAMGGKSIATMTEFLGKTGLKEQPKQYPVAKQMISNLLGDHETIIRNLRKDLETCASECHDMGTNNFLTDLMEKHEKMAWMLRAFLDEK